MDTAATDTAQSFHNMDLFLKHFDVIENEGKQKHFFSLPSWAQSMQVLWGLDLW